MAADTFFRTLEVRPGLVFEIALEAGSNDPIGLQIALGEYVYPECLALALGLAGPGARVVDLGSHLGTWALAAASLGARVIAVEAAAINVELLRASAAQNGFTDLVVVHAAVSAGEGKAAFLSAGPFGYVLPGSEIEESTNRVRTIAVDDCLGELGWQRVDVVKMDIEGAEVLALRGMRRLLSSDCAPVFVFEANGFTLAKFGETPNSLLAEFEKHGYRCYLIRSGQLIPVSATDFLPECNVDYLATKRPPLLEPQWSVRPPLGATEVVEQTLQAMANPGEHEQSYTLRALDSAPPFIRSDERVCSALQALRGEARSARDSAGKVKPISPSGEGPCGLSSKAPARPAEKDARSAGARTALAPLDLLVAWLVVLGILGAGLVALHIFEPNLVLVLGSGLTVAAVLATRHPIAWREGRIGGALLVVLLLGMLVRLPPYPHPNGGQDQGLYVSLSQVFEKRGGYVFDDPLRAQLSVDQAEIYRAAGGLDLPGVIPTARGDVIHFYPLHPVYMSLAATVMGSTHRVASLTLFAVLGLLALALLAGEITGRRDVALLAAALAAAHPGLSFFSKLPVAEMVALAFTATAAYYLARFARLADRGSVEPCWLILSTGSFLCACLTRPNGVFLLPALVVTVIALLVSDLPPQARKCILLYWPAALVSIALSYALFSMYWGELFWDVALGRVVGHFFGQRPLLEVVAVCAGSTILLGMLGRGRDRRERLHRLLERRGPHAVVVIWAICLAVLAWRAWVVLPDRDLLLRGLYLIEPGPTAVWRLVPYRLALYLSPLGALLLALFPFIWRRTLRGPICLLFVLVATVLLAFSRLPYSLYAYYYDRYLHGELVPFGLVLLAIVLGELRLRWRSFADAAAILVVAYFSVFTLFQVGKREGADPDLFERLRTGREEGDLFFLDSSTVFRSPAIATTLRFDLDLPVFPVASALDLPVAPLAELAREHRRAYLLSGEREPLHSFLTLDRVLRYRESYLHDGGGHMLERLYQLRPLGRTQTTGLASSWSRAVLPLRYSVVEQPLYLYRVDTDEWARGDFTTAVRFESETLPSGWNDVRLQIGDPWKASAGLARVARPEVLDWPHPHSALVHGPYHYLRAGSHRADFRLRSAGASGDAIVVGIDVAANQGARVLASRCLRSEDFPSGESYHTFSLPFESVEDLSGVEYRVWYGGVGAIWSDYVDLTSVAGGASPSVAGREAAPTPPGGDTCWLPPGR